MPRPTAWPAGQKEGRGRREGREEAAAEEEVVEEEEEEEGADGAQ